MASDLISASAPLDFSKRIGVPVSKQGSCLLERCLSVMTPDFHEWQRTASLPRAYVVVQSKRYQGVFHCDRLLLALRSGRTGPEARRKSKRVWVSRVRILRESVRMFADVLGIWFRGKKGGFRGFPPHTELKVHS